MTHLAHISDVHFGREDPELVGALLASVERERPDIIVISGDLTQRAKKKQFRAARAFLRALPRVPRLVVPGNHDVSATNLVERALRPFKRYRRYITDDLAPFYQDSAVAIAGVNTVRLFARKDGRINRQQVLTACGQLNRAEPGALRIIVTHHPMDLPLTDTRHPVVARAPMAMRAFAGCHVDLFLSGHLHAGLTVSTCARYQVRGWSAVVVHAGTAISTRTREQANAWNLLTLTPEQIAVTPLVWDGAEFRRTPPETYDRTPTGWLAHGILTPAAPSS